MKENCKHSRSLWTRCSRSFWLFERTISRDQASLLENLFFENQLTKWRRWGCFPPTWPPLERFSGTLKSDHSRRFNEIPHRDMRLRPSADQSLRIISYNHNNLADTAGGDWAFYAKIVNRSCFAGLTARDRVKPRRPHESVNASEMNVVLS